MILKYALIQVCWWAVTWIIEEPTGLPRLWPQLYTVRKCSKASWEISGYLEGTVSGPSLRIEMLFEVCGWLQALWAAQLPRCSLGDNGEAGFPKQAQQLQDCFLAEERVQLLESCFPCWIAQLSGTNLQLSLGKKQCSLSPGSGQLQPSSYLASRGSQVSQGCSALLCKAPFQAFLMGGKCRVIERMNGVSISTQPAGGRAAPPTRGCCWMPPSSHVLCKKMSCWWHLRYLCLGVPKASHSAGGKP